MEIRFYGKNEAAEAACPKEILVKKSIILRAPSETHPGISFGSLAEDGEDDLIFHGL
jgi:hypothetical protein